MLRKKIYIQNINTILPRGTRGEIASALGVSKSLVGMVLRGERDGDDIIRAAENMILTRGVEYIDTKDYISLAYEIMSNRTNKPFTALKKEVLPFVFPGLNFSLN